MTDAETRAELDARVRACPLCDLAATRNRAVPGDGPLNARIMFIGEAPGFNEDRQGRPFVGQAGTYLDELVAGIGLRRDDVYITNIVKCRPPDNRDPHPHEIAACEPYLDEQLRLFRPLVVVTLGRFSMAKFFPTGKISQIHGKPRYADGRVYFPLYHPAAVLRTQSLRAVMEADFKQIPALLAEAEKVAVRTAAPSETAPPSAQQTTMF